MNADRSIFVLNSDGDNISAASLGIQQGRKIDVHLKKDLKFPSDLIWSSTKRKQFADTLYIRSVNRGRCLILQAEALKTFTVKPSCRHELSEGVEDISVDRLRGELENPTRLDIGAGEICTMLSVPPDDTCTVILLHHHLQSRTAGYPTEVAWIPVSKGNEFHATCNFELASVQAVDNMCCRNSSQTFVECVESVQDQIIS